MTIYRFTSAKAFGLMLVLGATLLSSCRSMPRIPPVDVSEPGWTVRHGQAIWKPAAAAQELVGELILALHPDGRSLVQFSKAPMPILAAQIDGDHWQLRHIPQQRIVTGAGCPPSHVIWLHITAVFNGLPTAPPLHSKRTSENEWVLSNQITGETITAYLNP